MMDNLGMDSLSIGVSTSGMDTYREQLKADLLDKTVEKLNAELDAILQVINTGWQGVARDRFEKQLRDMCDKIGADLSAEYADLSARLDELQAFYFEQDQKLIVE